MGLSDAEKMDALLRILYLGDRRRVWKELYTEANLTKSEVDFAFRNIKADGFIRVYSKGDGTSDSHYVTITNAGISFFMRTNYVDGLRKGNNNSITNNGIYIERTNSSHIEIPNSFNLSMKKLKLFGRSIKRP